MAGGEYTLVSSIDQTRRRLSGDGFDGWVEQNRLWGVYPDEKIE